MPSKEAVSNITAIQSHGFPEEYWIVLGLCVVFSKKKSARKSLRIFFFFLNPGLYLKAKTALHGKGYNYSIARKDPELVVI